MEKENKRFEEWGMVDCNECTHYWDDSCDAVKQDDRRNCNSFLATRRVVIPARLNALEKRVEGFRTAGIIVSVVLLVHILMHILGCY